jgi:hypothetical protein
VLQPVRAWSRSLYWRIAVSFAVFTLGMLLVHNMLFRYLLDWGVRLATLVHDEADQLATSTRGKRRIRE